MPWDTKIVGFIDRLGYLYCTAHEPREAVQRIHGDAYFDADDKCDSFGCGKQLFRDTRRFTMTDLATEIGSQTKEEMRQEMVDAGRDPFLGCDWRDMADMARMRSKDGQ
jgi:hypothetical protein